MVEIHVSAADDAGLAHMLAGLLEANVQRDPARERLLSSGRGLVEIVVVDAGVTVALRFVPGALTVSEGPVPGPDLRVRARADDLLGLSTVPLRAGLPDPTTERGREVVAALLRGRMRLTVRRLDGLRLLRVLTRLLTVV